MTSKVLRLGAEDVQRIDRLSGLPAAMPLIVKLRVVLGGLEGQGDGPAWLRRMVREELERLQRGV